MKYLYIVRHAKSSWRDSSITDFERPLNSRGKRDAPFMGSLMREKGVKPDLLLSSPAKRAEKTCIIISKELRYPEEKIKYDDRIYEAGISDLTKVIGQVDDDVESLMIFGHNPGLTIFNNYLTENHIDNLPTCGIAGLELNIDSWKDISDNIGKRLFFEYPKKYFDGDD